MRLLAWAVCCALLVAGCADNKEGPTGRKRTSKELTNPPADNAGNGALTVKASASGFPITPENSKIEWVGTKPEGKHDGGFKQFSGSIEDVKPGLEGSKITVEIDAGSVYSDVPKLTNHLQSEDFFDVRTFATAKFVSTAIKAEKKADTTHLVEGDLTLHGVTNKISFPAKIGQSDKSVTLESKFTINRKDFGMTYGEGKIHNDVTITVAVKSERK